MILSRDLSVQPRDRAVLSIDTDCRQCDRDRDGRGRSDAGAHGRGHRPQGMVRGFAAWVLPWADPVMTAPARRPLAMDSRRLTAAPTSIQAPLLISSSFTAATAWPAAPHVRSYFPEALYINPEIITDGNGDASISIPIADSITTWRMAMLASTQHGALGTGTSSLKVFQDFFVDLDLPVTLTQGDRVSIPVAIYNYSGEPGEVSVLSSSRTTGFRWMTTLPIRLSRSIPAASAARSSPSKPNASASSS